MIGYILVLLAGIFIGVYLGNKIFREKFNAGVKTLANKMQQKPAEKPVKKIEVVTPKVIVPKPTNNQLPQDLSTLSKEELVKLLKNNHVTVVNKSE